MISASSSVCFSSIIVSSDFVIFEKTSLLLLSFLIGGVRLSFEVPVLKQLATTSFIYEGGVSLPPEADLE